ncbi:MAG: CRTAC1 family protein, partial [Planctomycetaceae bacterium]
PEAARAFWECLRLGEPGLPGTLNGLMLSLNQIERHADANKVAQQISKYSQLRDAIKTHFERGSRSQQAAMQVAESMADLGRIWEAEAWARLAVSLPTEPLKDSRERYLAIRSRLTVDTPWQLREAILGDQLDLADLPDVGWIAANEAGSMLEHGLSGQFNFRDDAYQRGWRHTCAISPEAETAGHWIYQSLGGGVGVLDFDLDGWPDLAAAMLDGRPLETDSSPNRIFRNLNGAFKECSLQAGYADTGFSQGITVGDYNEDGFPDIFDSNIGQNRLYRNNGDGTFEEIAAPAGLKGMLWTTSAAIVDIDGDGISDIYEANYCRGLDPYQHPCRNRVGKISTCPPLQFEAESDRIWRGLGDGTFTDASPLWMDQDSPGRGLGVVVGAFDERPGLDLYVANDMTVNHLWSGEPSSDGFRLAELGAIRGLGYSARSTSQASMGMAVGDPDGDGDTDFFLTHFADDHNTYYEQVSPGFWSDRSVITGLAAPSMKLLGFGTQWCDFDNNGSLELIVANGHVDDVDRTDVSFRMPPQLFHRHADGHWTEYEQELGEYFSTNHLGRALATLDVDRDGRMDVAITHLYEPVSLLTNLTEGSGSRIGLELKSTRGARDAIGATVTATIHGRKIWAQLTAGDGYMCSNERRISIGTGETSKVSDVTVAWPSGEIENFGELSSDHDYLLIEGCGEAFQMDR